MFSYTDTSNKMDRKSGCKIKQWHLTRLFFHFLSFFLLPFFFSWTIAEVNAAIKFRHHYSFHAEALFVSLLTAHIWVLFSI